MKSNEGFVDVPGGKVWFLRMGENERTPLVLLHGGPGFSHDSLRAALDIIGNERPVIFYDQLGSGNSDRPTDPSLWRTERFVEELTIVREALDLKEIHLLGHSWGTMLAASYLLDNIPSGVRSVIFSSPCLSAELWKKDADIYLAALPEDVKTTIARCEKQGTTDSNDYQDAMKEYYKRHVCRLDPWPSIIAEDFTKANLDVYTTMWGPSEFFPTGILKNFDCTAELHRIGIPSLFLSGRYDEATPETTKYYQSLVPSSEYHVFEKSAHMSYLEETDQYLQVLISFLRKVEAQ